MNIWSIGGKPHKRVIIHVPMKIKHVHHTHTIFKPIHHAVPVKVDEHEFHLVRPEKSHGWEEEEEKEYVIEPLHIHNHGYGHGRSIHGDLSKIHLPNSNYEHEEEDRDSEYENFEKYLKKKSKAKLKLFNNQIIGWKGRPDFDKIANEYLSNIKNHPAPEYEDYDQKYAPYDDYEDEHN